MNRFLIVITSSRKLMICLLAILFIILSAFFTAILNFPKVIETDNSDVNIILSAENENKQLKDILSSILPVDNNILFENSFREIGNPNISSSMPSSSPAEVLAEGKNLAYIFTYSDDEYLRPIYSNTWKQSYYQGWLYIPRKIISARHSLFTYVGGAGKTFDIEGELGFYPNVSIDNQNYLNLLIYNFDIQNVLQLGNQIVISGTTLKKGVQIISIKIDDVNVHTNDEEYISLQLCTPTGLEIDYQNVKFTKSSYEEEDFSSGKEESFSETYNDISAIRSQNIILKNELTHYISDSPKPIYFQHNGSYQTSSSLNIDIDLDEAFSGSTSIKYNILYDNQKYISPVFHPQWKEHFDRDWCYIPRKMYLNMKKLFVLPADKNIASDLCGELGFFEKYKAIENNNVGLLINNFSVSKVSIYEDNILVSGTPTKTGAQVVSLSKTNLTEYKEYAVRLVTTDLCEMDVDVIKN